MYETSRGRSIVDYLTGREMEETTYEEFRQALARTLVEEKGYPREALLPRISVEFPVDGLACSRTADLTALGPDGKPLMVLLFVSGTIASYYREAVALARLLPEGPAPLALVTDMNRSALMRTSDGEVLAEGADAIPDHGRMLDLAATNPPRPLAGERLDQERRILHTYSRYLLGCHDEGCGPAS